MYHCCWNSILGLLLDPLPPEEKKEHLFSTYYMMGIFAPILGETSLLFLLGWLVLLCVVKSGFQQRYEPRLVSLQSLYFPHTIQHPLPPSPGSFLIANRVCTQNDVCLSFHWCYNICGVQSTLYLEGCCRILNDFLCVFKYSQCSVDGHTKGNHDVLMWFLFFNWIKPHLGILFYLCVYDQTFAE